MVLNFEGLVLPFAKNRLFFADIKQIVRDQRHLAQVSQPVEYVAGLYQTKMQDCYGPYRMPFLSCQSPI